MDPGTLRTGVDRPASILGQIARHIKTKFGTKKFAYRVCGVGSGHGAHRRPEDFRTLMYESRPIEKNPTFPQGVCIKGERFLPARFNTILLMQFQQSFLQWFSKSVYWLCKATTEKYRD